jgi:predicted SprT family Zn-dependent metalloprotease
MGETRLLDFDCVEEEEREMGVERTYETTSPYACQCGNTIEITFEVWEYPEGAYNCENCSCSGGEVTVKPKVKVQMDG